MNKKTWAMRPMNEKELEVLELRESGLGFKEIAERVINEYTGKLGISVNRARQIYEKALLKKPRYEQKKAKEPKIAYVRSICEILLDDTKYIYKK